MQYRKSPYWFLHMFQNRIQQMTYAPCSSLKIRSVWRLNESPEYCLHHCGAISNKSEKKKKISSLTPKRTCSFCYMWRHNASAVSKPLHRSIKCVCRSIDHLGDVEKDVRASYCIKKTLKVYHFSPVSSTLSPTHVSPPPKERIRLMPLSNRDGVSHASVRWK